MRVSVILGIVLMAAGIIGLAISLAGQPRLAERAEGRDVPVSEAVEAQPGLARQTQGPSMLWPIVSGLAVAAGGALVGVGLGNWRRPQRPQPGRYTGPGSADDRGVH